MTSLEHRRALVQAVRTLEILGAMRLLDASTNEWEDAKEGHAGALLEFTAGAAYLISQPVVQLVTPLQRAIQALLTGPALHRSLDPEAFAALLADADSDRGIGQYVERTLGWTLEIQADYGLLLRGGITRGLAKRFTPGRGVVSSAGLLLLNTIRAEVQAGRLQSQTGRVRLTQNQLYAYLDQVRATHRDKWGQQAATSTDKILREILDDWLSWGAVRQEGEFWWLEAILSRFEAYYFDPDKPIIERAAGKRRRKSA
jgi:hypothetical protein